MKVFSRMTPRRYRFGIPIAVAMMALAGLSVPQIASAATFVSGPTDLGALAGFPTSNATAVNDVGQVVGTSCTAGETSCHVFSWTPAGGMVDIGTLPGFASSYPIAVSNAGQVVGTSYSATGSHAFSWTSAGGMVDLGTLPGFATSNARTVNDAGQVVGIAYNAANNSSHGFLWTQAGGMLDVTPDAQYGRAEDVNVSGQVVGSTDSGTGSPSYAFSWTLAGGIVDLGTVSASDMTAATAVNDAGQVVGRGWSCYPPSSSQNGCGDHVFSWTPADGAADLGTVGGDNAYYNNSNNVGQVVGWSSVAFDCCPFHAFVWTPGVGMVDLTPDATGYGVGIAVNDSGVVVGGRRQADESSFTYFAWTPAGGSVDLGALPAVRRSKPVWSMRRGSLSARLTRRVAPPTPRCGRSRRRLRVVRIKSCPVATSSTPILAGSDQRRPCPCRRLCRCRSGSPRTAKCRSRPSRRVRHRRVSRSLVSRSRSSRRPRRESMRRM